NLALQKLPVYRKELFQEMKKSAQEFCTGNHEKFSDAAFAVRDKTRINGRRMIEDKIISRTLLIKGLEFDHVIVLNVDHIQNGDNTKQNFYVAITRGAKSLTVLSSSPIFA
ncbi:MAG TPA: ATP-binding domain-containing protein, partial [Anaerolineales bacterium]|nr:ATP-binding domain-containing protein [Anaerolineales bacterium]